MRSLPRLLKVVPYVLLFLVLLGFAAKNTVPVVVRYYLGAEWQAPLVVVLLITFTLGAVAGILATLGYLMRQRRELLSLRRRIDVAAPSTESGTP
jgi:putative membrane protein